jgi:hypothetical protein
MMGGYRYLPELGVSSVGDEVCRKLVDLGGRVHLYLVGGRPDISLFT